jgi:polyhydroxybutyrate depolymerase
MVYARKKSLLVYTTVSLLCSALLLGIFFVLLQSRQSNSQQIATVQNSPNVSLESTRCSVFHQSPDAGEAQSTSYTISDGAQPRTYRIHTPNDFDPQERYPVIFSFDGIAGSGKRIESFSGMDNLPALVIYPDSLMGTNGKTAWEGAPYSPPKANDIQFVKNILAHISERYCIDTSHVFTVGMSNGGGFAVLVGCELGSRIRAVASVSGAYYAPCTRDTRGQSLLVIHSTSDRQVPIDGSSRRKLPAVRRWVADQATQRSCRSQIVTTKFQNATQYAWSHCGDDDASLRLLIVKNQQHGWLEVPKTAEESIHARTAWYIWGFLKETYAAD